MVDRDRICAKLYTGCISNFVKGKCYIYISHDFACIFIVVPSIQHAAVSPRSRKCTSYSYIAIHGIQLATCCKSSRGL